MEGLYISHWKIKNKGVPESVEGQRTKDERHWLIHPPIENSEYHRESSKCKEM